MAGFQIISGGADRLVKVWDAGSGKELHNLSGHQSIVSAVAFQPGSKIVASGGADGTIKLWNLETGKEIASFPGHGMGVSALAFSGNGQRLLSSSMDSTCLLWDLPYTLGVEVQSEKAPEEAHIASWWADLIGEDAGKAYVAIWRMARMPKLSVPFLAKQLHPVTKAQVDAIEEVTPDVSTMKPVSGGIRVTVLGDPLPFACGDVVKCRCGCERRKCIAIPARGRTPTSCSVKGSPATTVGAPPSIGTRTIVLPVCVVR